MTPQSFLASLLLLRPSTLAFLAILLWLLALPRLLWAGLCCFPRPLWLRWERYWCRHYFQLFECWCRWLVTGINVPALNGLKVTVSFVPLDFSRHRPARASDILSKSLRCECTVYVLCL